MYVADLDAITGNGDNFRIIQNLRHRHPALQLWVDAGIQDRDDYQRLQENELGVAVIGSETLRDTSLLQQIGTPLHDGTVLSLDFRGQTFLGPDGLDTTPGLWPRKLILMTLARVGGLQGPAMSRVKRTVDLAPEHRIYAAGGVRDAADLQQLQAAGASGVLLASALHSGRLDSPHLDAYR
jgi:phosphoribosylformimino-5-aminoimidazole carboxamide ribotide isomerase